MKAVGGSLQPFSSGSAGIVVEGEDKLDVIERFAAVERSGPVLGYENLIVARQHKRQRVACYRLERTLMGCSNPRYGGLDAPHQCRRVNKNK